MSAMQKCEHVCNCLCHNPQLSLLETKTMHTTPTCCDGKCDYCDQYITQGQTYNHLYQCHPIKTKLQKFQESCTNACRCPCHDPEFASVSKHKNGVVCCDGKCQHCGSFIVRNQMERHIAEYHPYINNKTIEIPRWLLRLHLD